MRKEESGRRSRPKLDWIPAAAGKCYEVGAVREPPTFSRSHAQTGECVGWINSLTFLFFSGQSPHRLAFGLPTPHKEGE